MFSLYFIKCIYHIKKVILIHIEVRNLDEIYIFLLCIKYLCEELNPKNFGFWFM